MFRLLDDTLLGVARWAGTRVRRFPTLYSLAVSLLGVAFALLAGAWEGDVATSFPLTCWNPSNCEFGWGSLRAGLVWSLGLGTLFFGFVGYGLAVHDQQLAREELRDELRSRPPRKWMRSVSDKLMDATDLLVKTSLDGSRVPMSAASPLPLTAVAVRVILRDIAELASSFSESTQARWGASLMFPIRRSAIPAARVDDVDAGLLMAPSGTTCAKLDGVLLFSRTFSAVHFDGSARDDTASPSPLSNGEQQTVDGDGDLPEWFALPLRRESGPRGADGRVIQIPGAPRASVSRLLQYVRDTRRIETWVDAPELLGKEVVSEIDAYFTTSERTVDSFLSLPIPSKRDAGPAIVLNIHCNHPGAFRDEHAAEQFAASIAPLAVVIRLMLRDLPESELLDTVPRRSEENVTEAIGTQAGIRSSTEGGQGPAT